MINGKIIGIDARMIEMSGIGTYIQHLMNHGLYDYALGNEEVIRKYDKNVKVIPFNAPIYGLKEQLLFPNKEVKRAGINLMHFPHYNVPFLYRGKYVVTVHDLIHIIFPEMLGNRIKYQYACFLMRNAVKKSTHIFSVSNNSKKDIHKYFGIDLKKITVTYNAVDTCFVKREKKDFDYLYDRYLIPRKKKLLLYVGNLKPHKNLITLLKAMKIMEKENIVLLLVGKAFKNTDLVQKEIELGIKGNIIHTGTVGKKELVDFYNLADIFVFPSLYEGFGIPPLEAMACQTPVIAANNSSIPEVVGDAAILFEGTDEEELARKIEGLLTEDKKRNELIINGSKRVKLFSWDKTINIIENVISGISL